MGNFPICPLCLKAIDYRKNAPDMHEALIPRSAVQGTSEETQELIMHRCNTVLLHHECHVPGTGGEEIWEKCLHYLVKWEGRESVFEYLDMMSKRMKMNGTDVLNRFLGYYPEEK